MKPTSPVLEGYQDLEVVLAKDQPQYEPLPVLAKRTRDGKLAPSGVRMSRWRLSDDERAAIARGGDVVLYVWTGNEPHQPVMLQIAERGKNLAAVAELMGLPPR